MIRKIAERIWWVPAWVWLLFAAVSALAIPREYRKAARPEPPEYFLRGNPSQQEFLLQLREGFLQDREDALWQLFASSVTAGIFLGLAVARWSGRADTARTCVTGSRLNMNKSESDESKENASNRTSNWKAASPCRRSGAA
jgi:hypothetical protein